MQRTRVTVSFDDDLLERVDEVLEFYAFRSRTHFIETAAQRYVAELEEELEEEE